MRKILLAALLAGTGSCNWYYNEVPSPDALMHAIPWFDHMIASKAVHPYMTDSVPRITPANTVPLGDTEGDWNAANMTGAMALYGFDVDRANALVRPTNADSAGTAGSSVPAVLRTGEELFNTYCMVCHGPAGSGQGAVRMGAPPLNTAVVAGRSDGYIYSVIRYGRNLMPPYG
ncbi:MAG: cytochrome c, partial [Gemmatimonadales bacterium]